MRQASQTLQIKEERIITRDGHSDRRSLTAAVVASITGAILYSRRSNHTQPLSRIKPKNGCAIYIDTSVETNPSAPNPQNRGVDEMLCFINSDRMKRFDKNMKRTKNVDDEMLKLLKIGMCCCECNVDRRWGLPEAVRRIEELKKRDGDADDYWSYGSEDVYSSRAMTDDDFSFSITA